MLRHRYFGALLDCIYSVQLTPEGHLRIIRTDGIPDDFVEYINHQPEYLACLHRPPLREILIDFAEFQQPFYVSAFRALCRQVLFPQTHEMELDSLMHEIVTTIESVDFVRESGLFDFERMAPLSVAGNAVRELEVAEERLESANQAVNDIMSHAARIAVQASVDIKSKLVRSVVQQLKEMPPFDVYGPEFESAWAEYCYALEQGVVLSELVEQDINERLFAALDGLDFDEKITLWMASGEAMPWVEAQLGDGNAVMPSANEMDLREVLSELRKKLSWYQDVLV